LDELRFYAPRALDCPVRARSAHARMRHPVRCVRLSGARTFSLRRVC
jgi:hypothetical protein